MDSRPRPRLALTAGEPAGVGPELLVRLAAIPFDAELVAIADRGLLERAAARCGLDIQLVDDAGPAPALTTAVQLRVDVYALRLPPSVFQRLKALAGSRWVEGGAILVTAREHRTREANREAARARIAAMVEQALVKPERRIKTKPTRASKERRLTSKASRSGVKAGRGKVRID